MLKDIKTNHPVNWMGPTNSRSRNKSDTFQFMPGYPIPYELTNSIIHIRKGQFRRDTLVYDQGK